MNWSDTRETRLGSSLLFMESVPSAARIKEVVFVVFGKTRDVGAVVVGRPIAKVRPWALML